MNTRVIIALLLTLYCARPACAGDFEVMLNSTNGSSAFRIQDAESNDLMAVRSDGVCVLTDCAVPGMPQEQDPFFTASPAFPIDAADTVAWSESYGWENHADAGYATGTPIYTESDPIWTEESASYATTGWVDEHYTFEPLSDGVLYGQKNGGWAAIEHGAQRMPRADCTITVGATGDFQTINAAIAYAVSNYMVAYRSGGFTCEVKLLSGFVMNEQVIAVGMDLSWIYITAEDASVSINRNGPSDRFGTGSAPAFGAFQGASTPTIGCLFGFTSGTNLVCGLMAKNCSRGTILSGGGFTNAETGVAALYASVVTAVGAKVRNAKEYGMIAMGASIIGAGSADASYSTLMGLYAYQASVLSASSAKASNCTGVASTAGIQGQCGSVVSAPYAVVSGSNRGIVAFYGTQLSCFQAQARSCGNRGVYASSGCQVDARAVDTTGAANFGFYIDAGTLMNLYNATGTLNTTANTLSYGGVAFR